MQTDCGSFCEVSGFFKRHANVVSAATNLILLFVKPLIVVVFSGVTRPLRSPRFFSRFRRAYHRSTENRQRITPVQQGKPNCLHNFNLTCEH